MPAYRPAYALRPAANDRIVLTEAGTVACNPPRRVPVQRLNAPPVRAGLSSAVVALRRGDLLTV